MPILALTLAIATGIGLQAAQSQSMRTYVSGAGKDGSACTETSPCRTLQAALAKTLAGGQIYALGSADYGYLSINKAVSIISGRGATGVLATSNVSGIIINAGANDIINLQGLNIDGAGTGANGIMFTAGAALNIKDSVVRGFATGISFQPSAASALSVTGTLLANNTTGVSFQSTTTSTGILADVQLVNNSIGLIAQGASSAGQAVVTLQSCMVANNVTVGIRAGSHSAVTASNCTIANNGIGLEAQSATAVLQMSGSTVTGNGIGWQVADSGQVISASNNAIGGNTNGNAAPPTSTVPSPPEPPTEPPPPPEPNVVARNIVTDFGATCDGVADDAPAFAAFNTWAKAQTLAIELTIPAGRTCSFLSNVARWWVKDVKKLVVIGYGATITTGNSGAGGFFLGGRGQYQNNAHSARVATVAAGSASVQLLTPSQQSRFTVGQYALLTGYDLQGLWNAPYGYPSNPHFFEYVKITNIDSTTGVIAFESPLKNTYKSTWPSYNSGNQFEVDNGGPATLYALDPSWDTEVEYRGLTISNEQNQTYANGRSVTYRDVTFTGSLCGVPTQNLVWQAINSDFANCYMEVDKLVETMIFSGSIIRLMDFQSSSIDLLVMDGSTITNTLNGIPKKAVITNSVLANFRPGAFAYGRTDEVSCVGCVISAISPLGIVEKGPKDAGLNNVYTMSGGTIIVPNTHGAVRWAVPGTTVFWTGQTETAGSFSVLDVTQDTTNTYVHTSLSGGFPPVPLTSGKLFIRMHPAPKFTCSGCTGSPDALDLSQAPPGTPIYSYSKRRYTGATIVSPTEQTRLWGKIVRINVNVIQPYTGTQGTLTLNLLGQFKARGLDPSDYSTLTEWNPRINTKVAGQRTITPTGVTGAQTGDTLSAPGELWLAGAQQIFASANVSSEPSSVWPIVEIEIITDQGLTPTVP